MHGFNFIVQDGFWEFGSWFWAIGSKLTIFPCFIKFSHVSVPKIWVWNLWTTTLKLKRSSGNLRICRVHSSEESVARAWKSSSQKFSEILQVARVTKVALERGTFSTQYLLERLSGGNFMQPVLLQTAQAKEVTLEWPPLFFILRSSMGSCNRAWTLFSANFEKLFKVHICILMSLQAFLDTIRTPIMLETHKENWIKRKWSFNCALLCVLLRWTFEA